MRHRWWSLRCLFTRCLSVSKEPFYNSKKMDQTPGTNDRLCLENQYPQELKLSLVMIHFVY